MPGIRPAGHSLLRLGSGSQKADEYRSAPQNAYCSPLGAQKLYGSGTRSFLRFVSRFHPPTPSTGAQRHRTSRRSHGFRTLGDQQHAPYVIEESAILFESGADRFMDRTVAVIAPETIRIRRVCRRDHQNEAAIKARIANQMSDEERARRADYILKADDKALLIPQILALHQQLLAL